MPPREQDSGLRWAGLVVFLLAAAALLSPLFRWAGPAGSSLPTAVPSMAGPAEALPHASEVASGLISCPANGEVARYIDHVNNGLAGPSGSAGPVRDEWDRVRGLGATAAAVGDYVDGSEQCTARPGEASGRQVFVFIARYNDSTGAALAFTQGFFGIRPDSGQMVPGVTHGTATDLGPDSWLLDQSSANPMIVVGFWRANNFTAFILSSGIARADFRRAALGVGSRLRQ